MDVEGLLNLEDYVPPQAEKQIAKIPKKAPKYEMDPSFWQLNDDDPPPLYEEKDPLAIEGPPDDDDDDEFVDAEEGDEWDEDDDDEPEEEANKILDQLDLPNYDDVDKRLAEPEMTATRQRNYLEKVLKDAETRRRQAVALKSNATIKFKQNKITAKERKRISDRSDKLQKEIKDYKKHYQSQFKSIKGSGLQRGRGAYFFNDAKEMLQKLTLIIAEMEAGNTSVKMRNMGQTILDALLHENHLNKGQYRQLVKKYFAL